MTPAEAVRKATGILGGQTALASRLDVRTPTVSQWCSGGRPVPVARAIQVEALTTERDFCTRGIPMTYNTGNALGSSDVLDLNDNAVNLDWFANGPAAFYPDRFGTFR
ncbi:Cro/CI family transcriptional regulator [Pseudomonas sp. 10S4]|uniref:transcriptional regulator n=1 Tax=Pseudomonas sp. 10S4 TaxID=3048583 RepID=UPI002AC9E3BE|nr:Cro/CI family transcriptional regulator [Pseudomonas sp. 10S4]WPX16857.1 Cro/CI family transcriptional regulator [Pseudomonas sp. 10S4]